MRNPYGQDKWSGTLAWDLADQWGPFKGRMIGAVTIVRYLR